MQRARGPPAPPSLQADGPAQPPALAPFSWLSKRAAQDPPGARQAASRDPAPAPEPQRCPAFRWLGPPGKQEADQPAGAEARQGGCVAEADAGRLDRQDDGPPAAFAWLQERQVQVQMFTYKECSANIQSWAGSQRLRRHRVRARRSLARPWNPSRSAREPT